MKRAPIPPNTRRYEFILPTELFAAVQAEREHTGRSVAREMIALLREALAARAKRKR